MKREELTTRITIQDQDGKQLLTSQSDAIAKIINVLKNPFDDGMASTESRFSFKPPGLTTSIGPRPFEAIFCSYLFLRSFCKKIYVKPSV